MRVSFNLSKNHNSSYPPNQGLYDPSYEHDGCGVGFIAHIHNHKSKDIIDKGLRIMCNLEHRGAIGADPDTGDGAGMLIQMPDKFLRRVVSQQNISLPPLGCYGVGMHFFPQDKITREAIQNIVEKIVIDENCEFLGWRNVPVDASIVGKDAREMLPVIKQSFIAAGPDVEDVDELERMLFMIRRMIDHRIRQELHMDRSSYYVSSFSCKTLVYKGMLTASQFALFYHDMREDDIESAIAMTHTRFSTNTFPSWDLAHPFRLIAHNGEINTLRGNVNWMRAREQIMESPYFRKNLKRMLPILMEGQSDSAAFDSVLELLVMSGRSLPHAMMMMIPEAWSKKNDMNPDLKGFYEYHATIMEPWDGPAGVTFTDGDVIGGTLDRNGLRPARYVITKDDMVILSSEVGVLDTPPENIKGYGRLQPGKMFLVDLKAGRVIPDKEIKNQISQQQPYLKWVDDGLLHIDALPESDAINTVDHKLVLSLQRLFLYTKEDIHMVLKPMLLDGKEAIGSMGTDVALSILSDKPQLLFRYFKQLFAQVTNPPVDAIREELVFELTSYLGPERNLLDETVDHAKRIELSHPIITNQQLENMRMLSKGNFTSHTLSILFPITQPHGMREALDDLCVQVEEKVRRGVSLIILSDRGINAELVPIPSLLAVSGVHHHLIRKGVRVKASIILESGEPREVFHFALLLGYGANVVNPYLAFETIKDLYQSNFLSDITSQQEAYHNYFKAIQLGLYKIFSKMGISTLQSYCGAQVFEAIGLDSEIVDSYFTGTSSAIEGLSLEMLEEELRSRHQYAIHDVQHGFTHLRSGGLYYYRTDGEKHLWTPESVVKLQYSVRNKDYALYKEYALLINKQENNKITLRSLLRLQESDNPLKLEDIEPAKEIVKRFVTGAMSFGSISWEAHTSLAVAMNTVGGKSNTGEGGEDSRRFQLIDGQNMRSAIKQVASGRFGVTAEYLVNADELQIKMAQGAKPGEGGQLPGFKVDKVIARIRHSTPGVTLISPPPHHDIYSIEDLKQLIFDLKNINPKARISVKLVSEIGVGTIAAGVAKAHADHILISGHDGGTGASPLSSIQYAGTPWELGLSETHQVLVSNGLRDRIWLQTDGQIKTGRDVIIAALMGADEFGFSTAPLVTQGCIMMRKCHLNTCPVGIATQDPELRKKFMGSPDYLINYMFFVAEEVREYMASLGFATFNEMIGQVDRLYQEKALPSDPGYKKKDKKIRGISLSKLLVKTSPKWGTKLFHAREQDHGLDEQLDHALITASEPALLSKKQVNFSGKVCNINRSVGAMLSHHVATKYGHAGLPDNTISITLTGYAGQSFGAFLARGIQLRLIGAGNDYVGKGLSGGCIIIHVPKEVSFDPAKNIIIGNTAFYGAIEGEAYINGMAGERFCVRNSGVHAVVEGVGDHGCEYMTGGQVVILGEVGRNFAAGMSGGIAYIWDQTGNVREQVNSQMVEINHLYETDKADDVHALITKHRKYTNSHQADYILNNWKSESKKILQIISYEYKEALKVAAN